MNPWEKYKTTGAKTQGNPWDRYAKSQDFTSNPNGEGLYRMLPASNAGFENTSDTISVPFSRVPDAIKSGFHLHPDEQARYGEDKSHPKSGPGIVDQIEKLLQPSEGPIGQMPIAPAGFDVNAAKAAGRVVAGTPGFIKDLAISVYKASKPGANPQDVWNVLNMVDPGNVPEQLQQQFHQDAQKDPKLAIDNLMGNLAGMGLLAVATHGATNAGAAALKVNPLEQVRAGIRDTLGVSENTEKTVKKFGNESEAVRQKNRDIAQEHSAETQDALHATRGAELKHEADKRLAASKAEEKNIAAAKEHLEKTQEALHKTKGAELQAGAENKTAKIEALKKNQTAEKEHQAKVQEVKQHNEAVLRDRAKRTETQEKLDNASKELDDKIDDAQKKAKQEDDDAWKAWRDKVSAVQVDMQPVVDAIKAQTDKMNPQQVAEFKDILRETRPEEGDLSELERTKNSIAKNQGYDKPYAELDPKTQATIDEIVSRLNIDQAVEEATGGGAGGAGGGGALKQVPASRLHGWKTQLEDAVRSDRAGNVKYAIGQVLDSVRKLEEDVSKQAGADTELKNARALHGPYVDTFRNVQSTRGTVANYVRSKVTPNFTKDSRLEDYIGKLGEFDPSIPKLVEHIDNLEAGLKALPKEQPLREQIKPLPEPPAPIAAQNLKVPVREELPDRPPTIEPEPVAHPVRVAPPDRPLEVPAPEAPDIHAENLDYINRGLRKYGKIGSWVLRLIFGSAQAAIEHGHTSSFGTDILMGQMGVTLLTHALRSPRVLDWLAKPSAEDMKMIATLPPEDAAKLRDALGALSEEDKLIDPNASKIKIAPIMAAFLAGGKAAQTSSNPQDLKKQAEQLKPAPLPPPGPQSSAKPYTHIYDPERNTIVAA